MNRYTIAAQDAHEGMKLMQFLRRSYPLAPEWAILKSLKARDIKVNGVRAEVNRELDSGDLVEWYTLWSAAEIPIIYEDGNLLIVSKPAGLNTDEHKDGDFSLLSWAMERARGEHYQPRLVHRLDNQTSGLIILAKNDQAQEALIDALRQREIVKRYVSLVAGCPKQGQAVLQDFMIKDAVGAKVQVYSKPVAGSKEIITEYRVIKAGEDFSRLEVTLHTGRTHQIRAHLAYIGHPVLGDDKYGDYEVNKRLRARRLMLAATELSFHAAGYLAYLEGRQFTQEVPF